MEDVELGKFNEFECQVSPDQDNHHLQLRAKAILNVIGGSCTASPALHSLSQDDKRKGYLFFNGLNWPKAISMEFPFIVKNCSKNVC